MKFIVTCFTCSKIKESKFCFRCFQLEDHKDHFFEFEKICPTPQVCTENDQLEEFDCNHKKLTLQKPLKIQRQNNKLMKEIKKFIFQVVLIGLVYPNENTKRIIEQYLNYFLGGIYLMCKNNLFSMNMLQEIFFDCEFLKNNFSQDICTKLIKDWNENEINKKEILKENLEFLFSASKGIQLVVLI